MRRLLLPTVLGTLLIPTFWGLMAGELVFDVDASLISASLLPLAGLLLVGLPAANWLALRRVGIVGAVPILILIGAVGGGTICLFVTLVISVLSGTVSSFDFAYLVPVFMVGAVPGAGIALLWSCLNLDVFLSERGLDA